jgi:hypothetical protein
MIAPPEPPPGEAFAHVRGIVGIVIGLCISRLLTGIARFVQHSRKQELYVIHLTWIAFTLLTVIHFWWFEFYLRGSPVWGFELYLFVIYYAALHFLLAALLVPDNIDEYHDYREYFLVIRKYFFGLLVAFNITDLVDTLIKGEEYFSQSWGRNTLRRSLVLLFLASSPSKHEISRSIRFSPSAP